MNAILWITELKNTWKLSLLIYTKKKEEKSQEKNTKGRFIIKNNSREIIGNYNYRPKNNSITQTYTNGTQYYFTIWDIPKEINWYEIKRHLDYFGEAYFIEEQPNFTTRSVYIGISTKIEK